MKILKHARKTVFVMSGGGGNCPRMALTNSSVKLRDDYRGSFKTDSSLIRKIIQIG